MLHRGAVDGRRGFEPVCGASIGWSQVKRRAVEKVREFMAQQPTASSAASRASTSKPPTPSSSSLSSSSLSSSLSSQKRKRRAPLGVRGARAATKSNAPLSWAVVSALPPAQRMKLLSALTGRVAIVAAKRYGTTKAQRVGLVARPDLE